MLKSKKYEKGAIVTFKMTNGDEIVAKIVDDQADKYIVSKPTTVMPSQQGIGLMQSLMTAKLDADMDIAKMHIMYDAPTVDEIKNHYLATTTGIQPASAGAIVV